MVNLYNEIEVTFSEQGILENLRLCYEIFHFVAPCDAWFVLQLRRLRKHGQHELHDVLIFLPTYFASSDMHDQIDGREVGEWKSVLDKFKQRKSCGPYFRPDSVLFA